MIFFEKLLKQRFRDKKQEELWEKYTYRKQRTTGSSYLVDVNPDKPNKNNPKKENNDRENNEKKKDTVQSIHPQYWDILDLIQALPAKAVLSPEKTNSNSQGNITSIEDICELFKRDQAYTSFQIRKKNSKSRRIKKPHPKLLNVQRTLLKSLVPQFPQHECAYGFVSGKSTRHHVEQHAKSKKYLIMDIQNFFNSCTLSHVATALENHTTLTLSQIKALLFLSMHHNFEETYHRKTNILAFFQSIQRSLFSYVCEFHGRRLARLIGRLAFHRTPFLHTYEHIFDEHFFIDVRSLHEIHQLMWSKDPFQLESFFGLRFFVLFKCILGHYPALPTAKDAFTDARNYVKQKNLHRDTISTLMKTGIPNRYTLPQGSPLSPWLANLCCYDLDVQIQYYAQKNKLIYSRYADDICLSGSNLPKNIVRHISKIIEKQGFCIQREKTRFLYPHQRQVVTGFVLNSNHSNRSQPNNLTSNTGTYPQVRLPRKYLKKIRAVLYNLDNGRPIYHIKRRERNMTIASLRGHLAYIKGHHSQAYWRLYKNSTWLQNNEI